MAARPQTLYGLADSPVGLAAWLLDHNDGRPAGRHLPRFVDDEPTGELTRDEVLDNITLYWLTNTGVSAVPSLLGVGQAQAEPLQREGSSVVPVAVGFTSFPGEQSQAPRGAGSRAGYPNLIYFNEVDRGGHFAAWEEPELFSHELRAAFRSLRERSSA